MLPFFAQMNSYCCWFCLGCNTFYLPLPWFYYFDSSFHLYFLSRATAFSGFFLSRLVQFSCSFHFHFPAYHCIIFVFLYRDQYSHEVTFPFLWLCVACHPTCIAMFYVVSSDPFGLLVSFPYRFFTSEYFFLNSSSLCRSLWSLDRHRHYHGLGALQISGWLHFP